MTKPLGQQLRKLSHESGKVEAIPEYARWILDEKAYLKGQAGLGFRKALLTRNVDPMSEWDKIYKQSAFRDARAYLYITCKIDVHFEICDEGINTEEPSYIAALVRW